MITETLQILDTIFIYLLVAAYITVFFIFPLILVRRIFRYLKRKNSAKKAIELTDKEALRLESLNA